MAIDYIDPLLEEDLDSEDKFRIIPEKDRIPELEEQVQNYMRISADLPQNSIKYTYLEIPDFGNNIQARKDFWREQVRRCKHGYNGMSGKMYFYYNFCYIEAQSGKIRPEYRVIDSEWFSLIESCQKTNKYGVICVKRRRVGASWKEAADVLHDCLFYKHRHVGMNSKSERDSILLFKKVKFLYSHLVPELRVRTSASQTKMYMMFGVTSKDENGNKLIRGNQSDIIVVAPESSNYEGMLLTKWVCDEAGKIPNLPDLWAYTEDCLMEETVRKGMPVIFGTSGDIGKEGAGLREMWEHADLYRLKKFFFAGWMGLYVDEYGNDHKEDCIRWVIYERKRRERSLKNLNTFIQKYPLTVEEAFMDARSFGMGDVIKLKTQRSYLITNIPKVKRGFFKVDHLNNPVFVPDPKGMCLMYEDIYHTTEGGITRMRRKCVAGCDPADMDDVFDEASDLSMYIMSMPEGTEPAKILFEFTDRPRELDKYYEQCLLALRYYDNTKVLIERQKGGRMLNYFSTKGYKSLLYTTPKGASTMVAGKINQLGIHMGPFEKELLKGLGYEYIDNYYQYIPSVGLIDECLAFGTKNTDKAMAFGITLIALKDEMMRRAKRPTSGENTRPEPNFKYVKDASGRVKRVPRY